MGLMLMTGVSGPLMDTFFLGGKFDRREIVATKATCQVASHFVKLIYFGGIIDQAATLDPVLAAVAIAASMTRHDAGAAHPGGHDAICSFAPGRRG